jgi:hypothetical protein
MTKKVEKPVRLSRAQKIIKGLISGNTTKYDEEYHCVLIIELFEKGKDVEAFCFASEICRSTFKTWLRHHPLFAQAYEHAKEAARTFLAAAGLQGMQDPMNFNATAWSMQMRNRSDYSEKRKVAIPGLKEAKTFAAQYECIKEEVAEGNLAPDEAATLANFVSTGAGIHEKTQMANDVEYLMNKDGRK